jgi:hypothetical protein
LLAAAALTLPARALTFTIASSGTEEHVGPNALLCLDRDPRDMFACVYSTRFFGPLPQEVDIAYVDRNGQSPVYPAFIYYHSVRWPAVAYCSASNALGVVWVDGLDSQRYIKFASLRAFGAASAAVTLYDGGTGDNRWSPPDIATVGPGTFMAVWHHGVGGSDSVYATRVRLNGAHTAAQKVSTELRATNPSLMPLEGGYALVGWQGTPADTQQETIRMRVLRPTAVPKGAPVRVSGPPGEGWWEYDICPSVAGGWRPGRGLVAWERARLLDSPGTFSLMGAHFTAKTDGTISVRTPIILGSNSNTSLHRPGVAWDHGRKCYQVAYLSQHGPTGRCYANLMGVRPNRGPVDHPLAMQSLADVALTPPTAWPNAACRRQVPTTYTNPVMVAWSWTNTPNNVDVLGWQDSTWSAMHQRWNDFNGDSVSDLAVYETATGKWTVRSPRSGGYLFNGKRWGDAGTIPVGGDFYADRRCDLACFRPATGDWYLRGFIGDGMWPDPAVEKLGDTACLPVPGQYDAQEGAEVGVYDAGSGWWVVGVLIPLASPPPLPSLAYAVKWGGPGMRPVPGDYDGDLRFDAAVFQPSTGNWFIRSFGEGPPLAFGLNWGNSSMVPVPGDYDGDGVWDLALYQKATGNWFIRSLDPIEPPIAVGLNWGGAWGDPVPGDYDGDGIYDLAVYERATGKWFIRKVGAGAPIVFGMTCGGPGFEPVGVCR